MDQSSYLWLFSWTQILQRFFWVTNCFHIIPVVWPVSSRLSKTCTLCSLFNNKYSITQNCWECVILLPCPSPGKCCYTLRSIVFYCLWYKLCIRVKLPALCWIKNKAYKGVTQPKLNSSNTVCKQKFKNSNTWMVNSSNYIYLLLQPSAALHSKFLLWRLHHWLFYLLRIFSFPVPNRLHRR